MLIRNNSGDTIVEVMIAIAVIGIVIIGASLAVNSETRNITNAHIRQQAIQVLQNQLELITAANLEGTERLSSGSYSTGTFCVYNDFQGTDAINNIYSNITYNIGDIVSYGSNYYEYINSMSSFGNSPTDNTYWQLLSNFYLLSQPSYDSSKTYKNGDIVSYDSYYYEYKNSMSSFGNSPTDNTYWQKIFNVVFTPQPISVSDYCNFDITGTQLSDTDFTTNPGITYDISLKLTDPNPNPTISKGDSVTIDGTVQWINEGDSPSNVQNAKISTTLTAN